MAVQAVTVADRAAGTQIKVATWAALTNGDTGTPVSLVDFPDMTVQFSGNFGTGGSIQLEGSNDNTNWFILTDPQGNNITKTAGGLETVEETPLYIRPKCTAGDGATAIVPVLLARRVSR